LFNRKNKNYYIFMRTKRKIILIFFGPPGSGKGTQAEMISEKIKIPAISAGKLLREEVENKTETGKAIEKIMSRGGLVPNSVIEKLLFKRMLKKDAARGFILDGYPRKKSQQDNLIKKLEGVTGQKDKIFAVLINVSDKEVKIRLGGRRICACGATYHIKFNPPKKKGICDLCGSKLRIRADDKPSVIADRLKIYHKEIAPIIDYWKKSGRLIKVDGERSIEAVHRGIVKSVSALINKIVSG